MARPLKTGLDYFPLDVKFDDEVNLIIADFGIEGLGVLITMYQTIYGNKGYYTDWTLREQKLFSRKVGLDFELSNKIISECIEWGVFNKEMFTKHSILTSRRIQEHYASSTYKRRNVSMNEEYLIIDLSDKKHVKLLVEKCENDENNSCEGVSDDGNLDVSGVSDNESTQSKVKYSKVKDIKDNVDSEESTVEEEPKLTVQQIRNNKILDYWNSKENLTTHRLTENLEKALNKISNDQKASDLCTAIKRYYESWQNPKVNYTHKWTLDKFVKQSNGYVDWLDEGARWVAAQNDLENSRKNKQSNKPKNQVISFEQRDNSLNSKFMGRGK